MSEHSSLIVRIAHHCVRHRRLVIAGWLVGLVAGFGAAPALFSGLTPEAGIIEGSESERGEDLVETASPNGSEIFAVVDGVSAHDPETRAAIDQATDEIAAMRGVRQVATPWTSSGLGGPAHPEAISDDGDAIALAVTFAPTEAGEDAVHKAASVLRGIDAPRVLVGGGDLLDDEMDEQAASDLARAEMVTTPVVLVLLVVFMGGLIAAGLPLLMTLVGMAVTIGFLATWSLVTDLSVYSINTVTMLGLGLAVDYALLIVARFREERAVDPDVHGAIARTMATAGRTVTFSGLTVAASLAGLLVFPDVFLRSAGLAGLGVVLIELAVGLTLIPALLAAVGPRIKPAKPRPSDQGAFARLARTVARRPVVVLLTVAPVLALAAVPFLDVQFADPDGRSLPKSSPSRQVEETIESRFSQVSDVDPVTVVAEGKVSGLEWEAFVDDLANLPTAESVTERADFTGLTVVEVLPTGTSQGDAAMQLVDDVRALEAPVPVSVTGDAAVLSDYLDTLQTRVPWALAVVVLATFVLLFLFTGSALVPVKALVLNTLSLAASFGALVWVFQDGNLGWLVGTEALGSLSITTPVLMFAIAFGLSMDYEVFLLGRISEAWRRTGDNLAAIQAGVQDTGRIVTAAALLMAVVFAGFVAGGFSPVKQVGFGLLLAVLVDAALVRTLLVPATMTMLGRANWWAPRPMRALHDRFGLAHPEAVPVFVRGDGVPAIAPVRR
ncbi:MAG: MMPL family transporter [Nocardioidaceae bacterium]